MLEMALIKVLLDIKYKPHRISKVADFVVEWVLRTQTKVEESSYLIYRF